MTSLADTIIDYHESKKEKGEELDEYGIPRHDGKGRDVRTLPQYYVARALMKQRLENPEYEEDTIYQYHTRENDLYYAHRKIKENSHNAYIMTGTSWYLNSGIIANFYAELKKRVPYLDTSVYKIADRLYWDKEAGEAVQCSYEEIAKRVNERSGNGQTTGSITNNLGEEVY